MIVLIVLSSFCYDFLVLVCNAMFHTNGVILYKINVYNRDKMYGSVNFFPIISDIVLPLSIIQIKFYITVYY